jgi:predicted enzyme related to lactoylglutathione lyase
MKTMKMTAPLEIGLCCHDLDSLAQFYVSVLDCSLVNVIEVPADKARPTALTDQSYRVARLQLPGGERIKLLQPARPPQAVPATPLILERANTAYITFILDDMTPVLERLAASSATVLTGPAPIEVRPGTFLAFVRDPEGNVLELVQYADVAAYRPDLGGR